jgi:hypothetical protein
MVPGVGVTGRPGGRRGVGGPDDGQRQDGGDDRDDGNGEQQGRAAGGGAQVHGGFRVEDRSEPYGVRAPRVSRFGEVAATVAHGRPTRHCRCRAGGW